MVILLPYIDYKSSHSSSFLFCTNDCKNGENFPVIINDLLDRQFIHPTVFKIFDILTKWVSSVIRQIFVFALRRLRWRYGKSFLDEFRNMQRNRNIIFLVAFVPLDSTVHAAVVTVRSCLLEHCVRLGRLHSSGTPIFSTEGAILNDKFVS